jgi:hypothetical protein
MKVLTKHWLENMKETDHLGDLGIDQRLILKLILDVLTGFRWLKIEITDGLFHTWQ